LASVEAGRPGQYVFRPRGRRLYGASRLVGDRRWGSQVRAHSRRARAVEQPVRPRGAQCYWGSPAPGTAAGESRLIPRTAGAGPRSHAAVLDDVRALPCIVVGDAESRAAGPRLVRIQRVLCVLPRTWRYRRTFHAIYSGAYPNA